MTDEKGRHDDRAAKPLLSYARRSLRVDADLSATAQNSQPDDQSNIREPHEFVVPPWVPPVVGRSRENTTSAAKAENISAAVSEPASIVVSDEMAEIQRKLVEIKQDIDRGFDNFQQRQLEDSLAMLAESEAHGQNGGNKGWKPLIDPRLVFNILENSKKILVASTAIGGVVAILYALSLPNIYTAYTDLLVDPRDIKVVERELTPGQLPTDATLAIAESQVRLIGSSSVLLKVIKDTDLMADPEFNGNAAPVGPLANIIKDIRGKFSSKEPVDPAIMETQVLQNLAKSLILERDAKTFIFTIGVKTQNPVKSANLANTISRVFQDELSSLQQNAARRTSEDLSKRLADLKLAVQKAENAVDKFRAEHDLIDLQGRSISDDDLARLNEQLSTQRAETVRLNARAKVLSEATPDSVLSGVLPEELQSNTLTLLRGQYATARSTADGLAMTLGPKHPQLIQAQSQVAGARREINAELGRVRSSLQVEQKRSEQQQQELGARLAQMKVQHAGSNAERVKLRELEREAEAHRSIYESFLMRSRETNEQESLNSSNVRVITEARPPLVASAPKRKMIVIAGLILGLMAGVGLALLHGFWPRMQRWRRAENPDA
ncbi:GumC family protein [Paenochrobactrum sp. BZR 588]|uniref:GumC family protein n=1 Tax=unclassified Paenochrobactrum TaxID=2639760 RepID=UPI0038545D0A